MGANSIGWRNGKIFRCSDSWKRIHGINDNKIVVTLGRKKFIRSGQGVLWGNETKQGLDWKLKIKLLLMQKTQMRRLGFSSIKEQISQKFKIQGIIIRLWSITLSSLRFKMEAGNQLKRPRPKINLKSTYEVVTKVRIGRGLRSINTVFKMHTEK